MSTIPTVDAVLAQTATGNGLHQWPVEGGVISVDTATLRAALEDAYDASMPNWPALVELDA